SNLGGLVMPILLELTYANGDQEQVTLPAETWRRAPHGLRKLLVSPEKISSIVVDPKWETADTDIENNYYPRRIIPSRIESFRRPPSGNLADRDIMHNIKSDKRD
ncbi:MAG: aminopeptidase, partial [Gammaproteobacteria bacterium]|nr:aminopeptidase [Gammaproteobacteria bacterium]